jgi:hypothetical protein
MRVIQFTCETDPPLSQLQGVALDLINLLSRIKWLASDPEYATAPFGPEQWHQHTQDPTLYWADWSSIYEHLGDDGRASADLLIGTPLAPPALCCALPCCHSLAGRF